MKKGHEKDVDARGFWYTAASDTLVKAAHHSENRNRPTEMHLILCVNEKRSSAVPITVRVMPQLGGAPGTCIATTYDGVDQRIGSVNVISSP